MEKTVTINGMKCDGCVNIVKENFEKIAGVQSATVDLEKNQHLSQVIEKSQIMSYKMHYQKLNLLWLKKLATAKEY